MAQYISQCKAPSLKSSTPKKKKTKTDPIIFNSMKKLNGIIIDKIVRFKKENMT